MRGEARRLKAVLDCSRSTRDHRRLAAHIALYLAEATGSLLEAYAFPGGDAGVYRVPGAWAPGGSSVVERLAVRACEGARLRHGTPLARAIYEATFNVYEPRDPYRTVVVTDGECTYCGPWLERLKASRAWRWRLLIVLTRDPGELLEHSKYRKTAGRLLEALTGRPAPDLEYPLVYYEDLLRAGPGVVLQALRPSPRAAPKL